MFASRQPSLSSSTDELESNHNRTITPYVAPVRNISMHTNRNRSVIDKQFSHITIPSDSRTARESNGSCRTRSLSFLKFDLSVHIFHFFAITSALQQCQVSIVLLNRKFILMSSSRPQGDNQNSVANALRVGFRPIG